MFLAKSFLHWFLYAFIIMGMATACEKNQCAKTYPLRTGIVESIPYQQGKTATFSTNEGETFTVNITRKEETLSNDAQNCNEYLEVVLNDPKGSHAFVESVQRGSTVDSMLQFVVSPRRKSGTASIVQFSINKQQEFIGLSQNFTNGVYQATRLSSVSIGAQVYKDVLKLDYIKPANDDSILQFLYNKTFGILQVRTKSGYTVTRVN